ncbi:MAG TPA: serine--tRNA ligase [Dehalococcoidia bacterium]|nr:serine--tRNA ligase [Dehalococcoidia bacterium]
MLDIHFIREHVDEVRRAIEVKQVDLDLDRLLSEHQAVVRQRQALDELNRESNENAKRVPSASPDERPQLIERGRAIGAEIREAEQALREAEARLNELLLLVPNIPDPEAPVGGEEDSVEVRRWGTPRERVEGMRDQVELLEQNGWAEWERPSRIAGARNYMLKGQAVALEMALWRLAMDMLVARGFTAVTVPSVAREAAFIGTGHFPTGRDQVYYLQEDDLYLSGTAEVLANSLHSGEILAAESLPIRYAAFSPCFRREAGSAGRDVRGLIRVHQFTKIEQYVLCAADRDESARWFATILGNAEAILQALEIPYRVIMTATADMGTGKVRMWDIESWVPSEGRYRETHSCSELYDWQARRSDLRYRETGERPKFAYTLNNTALATPRIMVPFLENHQLDDGDVAIPAALRPYLLGAETMRAAGA